MMEFFKSSNFLYVCVAVAALLGLGAILRGNNVWHSRGITPRVAGLGRSTYTLLSGGFGWIGSCLGWLGSGRFWKAMFIVFLTALFFGEGVAPMLAALPPVSQWREPSWHEIGVWIPNHPSFALFWGALFGFLSLVPALTGWEKKGKELTKVFAGIAGALALFGLWTYLSSAFTAAVLVGTSPTNTAARIYVNANTPTQVDIDAHWSADVVPDPSASHGLFRLCYNYDVRDGRPEVQSLGDNKFRYRNPNGNATIWLKLIPGTTPNVCNVKFI